MHLVASTRFLLRLLRTSLHAAVVVTASLSLFLLFLLWSVLQLLEEPATAASQADDTPQFSAVMVDRRSR